MKSLLPIRLSMALFLTLNATAILAENSEDEYQKRLRAYQEHIKTPSLSNNPNPVNISNPQAFNRSQSMMTSNQQQRMDRLLSRWEKQADRYDAVLRAMEKKYKVR